MGAGGKALITPVAPTVRFSVLGPLRAWRGDAEIDCGPPAQRKVLALLLVAASLVGTGSSVFHPESSRVARMASGGKHGFAQSVFQVGGNLGSSAGPLVAAFVVLPHGQSSVAWFSGAAMLGMFVLFNVGHWYKQHGLARLKPRTAGAHATEAALPKRTVQRSHATEAVPAVGSTRTRRLGAVHTR